MLVGGGEKLALRGAPHSGWATAEDYVSQALLYDLCMYVYTLCYIDCTIAPEKHTYIHKQAAFVSCTMPFDSYIKAGENY